MATTTTEKTVYPGRRCALRDAALFIRTARKAGLACEVTRWHSGPHTHRVVTLRGRVSRGCLFVWAHVSVRLRGTTRKSPAVGFAVSCDYAPKKVGRGLWAARNAVEYLQRTARNVGATIEHA